MCARIRWWRAAASGLAYALAGNARAGVELVALCDLTVIVAVGDVFGTLCDPFRGVSHWLLLLRCRTPPGSIPIRRPHTLPP